MRTKVAASVEEFLDCLNPARLPGTMGCVARDLLCRGHANAAWELVPRAWRPRESDEDAWTTIRAWYAQADSTDLEKQFGVGHRRDAERHRIAERLALRTFALDAERAGLPVPPGNPMTSLSASGLHGWDWPRPDHPVAALAAHSGVPTRLLEVSTNPLAAAGFAAWELPSGAESLAVVVIRRDLFPNHVRLHTYARAENRYLHAQDACAIEVLQAEEQYERLGRWPTLEGVLPPGALLQIELPATLRPQLAEALQTVGVLLSTLMPSYATATATLRLRARLGLIANVLIA